MGRWNLFKKAQPKRNDDEKKPTSEPTPHNDTPEVVEETPQKSTNVYDHTLYSIEHPSQKQAKPPQQPQYKKTEYVDICKIEHNIDKIDDQTHQKSSIAKDAYFIGELEHRVDQIIKQKKQTK